jgi:DNA replication protein DnaC
MDEGQPVTTEPTSSVSIDIAEIRINQAREILPRHIPVRYRNAKVTAPGVAAWVADVVAGGTDSLLLAGKVGVGKTFHGYAALAAVVLGKAARGESCQPAAITHGDLCAAVRPDGEGIDRILTAGILLLDDLGAAHTTAWNADAVYRVVDHRWAEMLPTIVTSNFDPGTLSAQLSERVTSRLFGMCRTVELSGTDRRMQ